MRRTRDYECKKNVRNKTKTYTNTTWVPAHTKFAAELVADNCLAFCQNGLVRIALVFVRTMVAAAAMLSDIGTSS